MFIWIARRVLYALGIIKAPKAEETWVLIPIYNNECNPNCYIGVGSKSMVKYTINNISYEIETSMFVTLYQRR